MSDDLSSDATCFQRNKIITWAGPAASALFAAAALCGSKQTLSDSAPASGLDPPSQTFLSLTAQTHVQKSK